MNFKSVSNNELIRQLKVKAENERKLLMEILYALREVEIRKLHLEMGYPDLYTFAMKELGYSSGAAYRRISAMRLLQAVPEAAPKLESGELGLENASQAQSFFRKEDQRRKEQGATKLAHKNFEGRMDILIDQLADLALSKLKPKPRLPSPSPSPAPGTKMKITNVQPKTQSHSRYIPVSEKRIVLLKDQNGCTYKDPNRGRACQSKHGLQFEHIKPFSQGGSNHAENLTLLCGAHNRYQAERMGLDRPH